MKTPSVGALELAAEWLDCYEGEEHAPGEIGRVADWLRSQADAAMLRAKCRAAGVPVAELRKRLSEKVG